jgi:hypothetical protein
MRSGAFILAVCGSSLAVALAGCGGASDNGVAAKSPDAIVNSATSAVSGVKSVHVSGTVTSNGSPITLDLNLAAGKGGGGEMSQSGLSFKIIDLNNVVYLNGSDAFWRHVGGNAAAQLFHGKWLRAPATGQFASIAALTDVRTLFSKLLTSHGTLAKDGTSTVAGQKVIAVRDTTMGGTLYVATTGPSYPIKISKSGSNGGSILFDQYNQGFSLKAPSGSIDVSNLK